MIHSVRWPPLFRVQFRHRRREWLATWHRFKGLGRPLLFKYVLTAWVLQVSESHHENPVPLCHYCHRGVYVSQRGAEAGELSGPTDTWIKEAHRGSDMSLWQAIIWMIKKTKMWPPASNELISPSLSSIMRIGWCGATGRELAMHWL